MMWRTVARIPLEERLDRMEKGYAGDVTYNDSFIRSMMDAPIALYLMYFQKEQEQLAAIFHCSVEEVQEMPYWQAVKEADRLWARPGSKHVAEEIIRILSRPLQGCCEERKKLIERNKKDTFG